MRWRSETPFTSADLEHSEQHSTTPCIHAHRQIPVRGFRVFSRVCVCIFPRVCGLNSAPDLRRSMEYLLACCVGGETGRPGNRVGINSTTRPLDPAQAAAGESRAAAVENRRCACGRVCVWACGRVCVWACVRVGVCVCVCFDSAARVRSKLQARHKAPSCAFQDSVYCANEAPRARTDKLCDISRQYR